MKIIALLDVTLCSIILFNLFSHFQATASPASVFLFAWNLPQNLFGMGDPISS